MVSRRYLRARSSLLTSFFLSDRFPASHSRRLARPNFLARFRPSHSIRARSSYGRAMTGYDGPLTFLLRPLEFHIV